MPTYLFPVVVEFVMPVRVVGEKSFIGVLEAAFHTRSISDAEIDISLFAERVEESQACNVFVFVVAAHVIIPQVHFARREKCFEIFFAVSKLSTRKVAVNVHAPAERIPLIPFARFNHQGIVEHFTRYVGVHLETGIKSLSLLFSSGVVRLLVFYELKVHETFCDY